jgi:hypothetical protein
MTTPLSSANLQQSSLISTSKLCRSPTSSGKVRLRLVREKKIFGCHIGCVRRGFRILIKKQITEPIRKLRDESNDTHVGYCST